MTLNQLRQRRGSVLIFATIGMFVIAAFMSLAVDLARARLVQSELQAVADAAARAVVIQIKNRTNAKQAAIDVVAKNKADNTSVTLVVDEDVEFGKWNKNDRTFSKTTSGGDAVRVTIRRTTARGNAVPLMIAPLIGMDTCNVAASAIARKIGTEYTLVGIDGVTIKSPIDSYRSDDGTYAVTKGSEAVVVSNGDINNSQGGDGKVSGDAHPGIGKSVSSPNKISGSTEPLTEPLEFAMPTLGTYNNAAIQSKLDANRNLKLSGNSSMNIPAGSYYLNDIDTTGNAKLYVQGDVTIYVSGSVKVRGTFDVINNDPSNLKLRLITVGKEFDMSGNASYFADVYAPGGAVTVGGTSDFHGAAIGKTLYVNGKIHHDLSVEPFEGNKAKIKLVK